MIDRWDCVGAAGAVMVIGAAVAIYWPVGMAIGGLMLCGLYYLRESR